MTSERRSEADCASYEQFKSQFGELLKNITNCFHPFPVPSVVIDVDVATRNIQLKMTGHAISWSCYFYKEITVPTFYRIVNEIPRLMKAARAEAGPLNSIRHPPGRSTNSFAKVPHVANTPIKAPQCRSEKEFALQPPLLGYHSPPALRLLARTCNYFPHQHNGRRLYAAPFIVVRKNHARPCALLGRPGPFVLAIALVFLLRGQCFFMFYISS